MKRCTADSGLFATFPFLKKINRIKTKVLTMFYAIILYFLWILFWFRFSEINFRCFFMNSLCLESYLFPGQLYSLFFVDTFWFFFSGDLEEDMSMILDKICWANSYHSPEVVQFFGISLTVKYSLWYILYTNSEEMGWVLSNPNSETKSI